MTFEYDRFFPFDQIRDAQKEAIDYVLNAFHNEGKRFAVCEVGTGGGKSAIGLTIARWMHNNMPEGPDSDYLPGAYFLTTQKILQDQYVSDFPTVKQLMSSSNYNCKFLKGVNCADSQMKIKIEQNPDSSHSKCCRFGCVYKEAKREFINADESITNFSYFLTETSYIGKLEPRQLLVIDEAHNIDGELCKFIEVTVSERFAKTVLKLEMPEINTQKQAWKWLSGEYIPKLRSHINHVVLTIEKFNLKERINTEFQSLMKQFEMLEKHQSKIEKFIKLYDEENWVFEIIAGEGKAMRKLMFKPIDVSSYTEQTLFKSGRHVLMMSATILDKKGFCQTLGINEDDCAFISIPSPFPPENHTIVVSPVAKMSASTIDQDLPKLAIAIQAILDQHPNDKGVIHAHSYKIANYLKRHVKSKRLIFHDNNDRNEKLEKHIKSKQATVLVSPSMQEGVDLKDDLSRFQIICKIPYPYLGDKIVKKRMSRWGWWYPLQTTKTIVQSLGRSIRNYNDHAVSYILDADWNRFYDKHKNIFPETFRKSIIET